MNGVCLLSLALMIVLRVSHADEIPSHLKEEGHKILKRFAGEEDFEDHDIAHVLHEKQPNNFHHINRRDLSGVLNSHGRSDFINLRLDLTNSGESLRLRLKRSPIVDDNTKYASYRKEGHVRRSSPKMADCLATARAMGSPNEITSVSVCNGLHGFAIIHGIKYYFHPVESETGDGKDRVHLLWRRSTPEEDSIDSEFESDDVIGSLRDKRNAAPNQFEAWKHESDFTIELAMFTDASAWQRLQKIAPGREDEYLLISMAATNALYGDKDKVGYNVFFKVRLLEHWEVDPEEYDFQQNLLACLRSFCRYTTDKYDKEKYDMHFLHNGVTTGTAAGFAFAGGVCGTLRCANTYSLSSSRHRLVAHEIGHNLGFRHHRHSKCPDEIKSLSGGFMGGPGGGFDFSPCNRWELQDLFKSGKGACLFDTKGTEPDLTRVFPGQSRSPDKLCELYAGFGYEYFSPSDLFDNGACDLFLCLNTNKTSFAYQNIKHMTAPVGFPCGEEKFCLSFMLSKCQPWTGGDRVFGWDVDYLRSFKQNFEWSSWPQEWSECSSTCGNGVQIKERKCLIGDSVFVSPHCHGSDNIKARMCATTPCADEPETVEELRKTRADEQCASFHGDGVQLESDVPYLPHSVRHMRSKYIVTSCLLYCQRENGKGSKIDGVLKDGTPCLDATRNAYDLQRFGIEMRCAKGRCLEFSDCPDNEPKDDCGVCTNTDGYDGSRCISESFSHDIVDLPRGEKFVLATISAGSSEISVSARHMVNARLEMWTGNGSELIWGDRPLARFHNHKYLNKKRLDFVGTKWSLNFKHFARADGPISESVMFKVIVGTQSIQQVNVIYLLP